MLREQRARRMSFDAASGVATLACDGPLPAPLQGRSHARLLLDGHGALVGVDLGDEPSRLVVLFGRHEDVEQVIDAPVDVRGSDVGIPRARNLFRV